MTSCKDVSMQRRRMRTYRAGLGEVLIGAAVERDLGESVDALLTVVVQTRRPVVGREQPQRVVSRQERARVARDRLERHKLARRRRQLRLCAGLGARAHAYRQAASDRLDKAHAEGLRPRARRCCRDGGNALVDRERAVGEEDLRMVSDGNAPGQHARGGEGVGAIARQRCTESGRSRCRPRRGRLGSHRPRHPRSRRGRGRWQRT